MTYRSMPTQAWTLIEPTVSMDKQEKARRLLKDVSAGLTALTRAVLNARSASPFAAPSTMLDRVHDHAQRLSTALDDVQARWPDLASLPGLGQRLALGTVSDERSTDHVPVDAPSSEKPIPGAKPPMALTVEPNRAGDVAPEVTPEAMPEVTPEATQEAMPEVSAAVTPLLLQGDLAPFEPEHDRPQDQDVIAVLPVPMKHSLLESVNVGPSKNDDDVLTLPILPLPVGERRPVSTVQDQDDHDHDDDIEEVIDDIQPDVLPIFFDELPELIDAIPVCFELVRNGQAIYLKNGQETDVVHELHRLLHTLKGNAGMVGAKRARTIIHAMEGMMEEAEAGRLNVATVVDDLEQRFDQVQLLIAALERSEFDYQLPKRKKASVSPDEPVAPTSPAHPDTTSTPSGAAPIASVGSNAPRGKGVRVNPDMLDRLVNEANEAKLTRSGLESSVATMQGIMRDLDENVQGLIKMLRELEIHAESQIQSRRSQIEESGEEFDPLEFDRFTRLQELARFLSERAHDTLDLQQGASRAVAEQETLLAYQERSINELQNSLTKTRLIPFDSMTDPLVKMTKLAAREEGKEVDVVVVGERTELDRALIEKISSPLQHALRNAVVHGIENREDRVQLGKPIKGQITITVRQEAGRVFINVQDDGGGIRVDKVRQKAIERGLWSASAPMSDQEAADMVCAPHFSTVDTVSQLAGRGVGMDVVRSEVLALGGRFDLHSTPGKGLIVALQLPTTLSTAATLIVEAQGERVAIPVECIEHVLSMKREDVMLARERGWIEHHLQGDRAHRIDFRYLPAIMGLKVTAIDPPAYNQVVLVRESHIVVAVLVDRLIGTQEVPIRPIGRALSRLPGIVGTTVLSNGHAAFVLDPARTRAAFVKQAAGKASAGMESGETLPVVEAQEVQDLPGENDTPRLTAATHRGPPLVMVVDDSLTVRKASARFLQREGYAFALAKDGQEGVEMLATVTPDLILLDVEMPRMDGFDFAKHVREHPRHNAVPIIMITSRIADKHRKRADAIGVNDYLGKPFKEEELLALLQRYTGQEA